MFKYLKGDILIFTERGLIRTDNINKEDKILVIDNNNNYSYEEIDDIKKTFKKNYKLNKINFTNNIDSYFMNDNIEIRAIQNLPLDLDISNYIDFIDYNKNKYITNTNIENISCFDYIGFPLITNEGTGEGTGEINRLFGYDKTKIKELYDELVGDNNEIIVNISEKNKYYLLKYVCLLLGIHISSYYNHQTQTITVKIPTHINKIGYNFFIYDNYIWYKVKSVKKINDFNGNLYTIELKDNNKNKKMVSDIGIIS